MEFVAILIMIGAGVVVAMFVLGAMTISKAEARRIDGLRGGAAPTRDDIAASLLFQVLVAGGISDEDALREIRRGAGSGGRVTRSIDVANWGEAYAHGSSPAQREMFLDTVVRLIAARGRAVPLMQYVALLDLSFALGFQTDALAKLRTKYGFEYVDHAKDARPREADRAGRTTFFARDGNREKWLALLELEGDPSRQTIISAYRRLAAQNHPDRFYGASTDEQSAAAARFIELTRAYEALLSLSRD